MMQILLLAFCGFWFNGCYHTSIQDLGPGEKIMAQRPGTYEIALGQAPTPARPVFSLAVLHRPQQDLAKGRSQLVRREKKIRGFIGGGLLLQWGTLVGALRLGQFWIPATVATHLLGLVSLATAYQDGGYTGWLLPEIIEKERLQVHQTMIRQAPHPEPAAGATVEIRAGGRQRAWVANAQGQISINLPRDLGLETFARDQATTIEISVPLANYHQTHHVLPSQFLHQYYRFAEVPFFADQYLTAPALGTIQPDRIYRLVARPQPDIWGLALTDGTIAYIAPQDAELAYLGRPPATATATSAPAGLFLEQLDFRPPFGADYLTAGQQGTLHLVITNSAPHPYSSIRLLLRSSAPAGLAFDARVSLEDLAPGQRRQVAIPVRALATVVGGTQNLFIRLQAHQQPQSELYSVSFTTRPKP
ncbi:MAG: hypothetical protein GKR89_10310 [Candidatus Latescibacteria bacterium]|nr:hypothetical protein [Candidatus Latescibacterota bacterium]